jgi:pimeloyl-ACP methyl ester carboxylesterase
MAQSLGAKAVGAAAALAVGVVAGVVAERRLIGRKLTADPWLRGQLGSLRGDEVVVDTPDGVELHVEVDTPPGFDPQVHPTVVFSHGYSLNHNTWHFQRAAMRPLTRLVFWDQRAHGRSTRGPAGSHNIDRLGRDLYAVIAAVAPEGPLMLVGHSMGGMTVMSLAADHPELMAERVVAVALLGTSSGGLAEAQFGLPKPVARAAHRMTPFVAPALVTRGALIEASRERASDLAKIVLQRYSFGSDVPAEVAEFSVDMINATPLDVVGEFLPTFDQHDKRDALASLHGLEVLVMVGKQDKMTPLDHSFEIVRRVPHAELIVLNETGHMLMLERPDEVNRELIALYERGARAFGHDQPDQ